MATYKDIRDEWVPEDANIILETDDSPHVCYVVYTYGEHLNVLRFFVLGVHEGVANWVVSHDYGEHVEDIPELT